jgi:hypothetical protein
MSRVGGRCRHHGPLLNLLDDIIGTRIIGVLYQMNTYPPCHWVNVSEIPLERMGDNLHSPCSFASPNVQNMLEFTLSTS